MLAGVGDFALLQNGQASSGAHSHPVRWAPSALSQGAKRSGHEADHSHPFNAEFKISGTSPPILVYVLVVCVGKILLSLYQDVRLSKAVRCSSFGRLSVSEVIVSLSAVVFQTSRSGLPPTMASSVRRCSPPEVYHTVTEGTVFQPNRL